MSNGEETKTVSANVPAELYWAFKKVQAERKETAQDAVVNAIRLYIDMELHLIRAKEGAQDE